MATFYGRGSTASTLQSHVEEAVYFLPLSSQNSLVHVQYLCKRELSSIDKEVVAFIIF